MTQTFSGPSKFELPPAPPAERAQLAGGGVAAWSQAVEIRTYEPAAPSDYPMFLDRRVYQGSSGRVYPLPFVERINTEPTTRAWTAIHLENRWIRLMILPELGGRIHVGYDKTADYDFFYRNNVIKPALVGLAGPWISGGVEFNWPQHHRPSTFLPVDWEIERGDDGSVTVWCSDHEPFARMKGMHGVRLHPDRAVIELVVRLHNRTDFTQSFLWWANVAARSHDEYQSFFPTDVHFVADHAKRAVSAFPRADRPYYDVDYPRRASAESPDADRLDYYRNIPVPTSYMVLNSEDDFFGGYDHSAKAGFVHVADHHISPGKKQWTWGNSEFGHAWDRLLTDEDGPYVELMAGVYTDNQPDFSYIGSGETKQFSQVWYPIQEIGVVHQANPLAAVHLEVDDQARVARIGVGLTADATVAITVRSVPTGIELASWLVDVGPGHPYRDTVPIEGDVLAEHLELTVRDGDTELIRWRPRPVGDPATEPDIATEPLAPADIVSIEELFLTGVHLSQYRHPTRGPLAYWQEALRRDPGDARTNVALALTLLRQGKYADAVAHAERAIERLTMRNPNPADGEPFYVLGLALLRSGRTSEAYNAFAKAAWDVRQAHAAQVQLAFMDAGAGRDDSALSRLSIALRYDADNVRALALRVTILRRLGRFADADRGLAGLRAIDPLDQWARLLAGLDLTSDPRALLDVALDARRAGAFDDALSLLSLAERSDRQAAGNTTPIVHYVLAHTLELIGRTDEARALRSAASSEGGERAFPHGLDEFDAIVDAIGRQPDDARAHALLGIWLYDAGRGSHALAQLREATRLDDSDAGSWRNLAIVQANVENDFTGAALSYDRALTVAPDDARLRFERDQLAVRLGESPESRYAALATHENLVSQRDDLTVVFADLLITLEREDEALELMLSRSFQPWEGGEGQVLGTYIRGCIAQAIRASSSGDNHRAIERLDCALHPPLSLGEARLVTSSQARLLLLLGDARAAAEDRDGATAAWREASADLVGVRAGDQIVYDEESYFSGLAMRRLGESAESVWFGLERHADVLRATPAKVDYFATSLPDLLLFPQDIDELAKRQSERLVALAQAGRGNRDDAILALEHLIQSDGNDEQAIDLLRCLRADLPASATQAGGADLTT